MGLEIRDQLRRDREEVLTGLEALGATGEDRAAALARLAELRRCWKVHVLAREAVIYRALEGGDAHVEAGGEAEDRLAQNKRVDALFESLSRTRPASLTWNARLDMLREMIQRHLESESDLALRLEQRLPITAIDEISEQFRLVRQKLSVLEDAKAA